MTDSITFLSPPLGMIVIDIGKYPIILATNLIFNFLLWSPFKLNLFGVIYKLLVDSIWITTDVLALFFKSKQSSKSWPKHIIGFDKNLSHLNVNLGSRLLYVHRIGFYGPSNTFKTNLSL